MAFNYDCQKIKFTVKVSGAADKPTTPAPPKFSASTQASGCVICFSFNLLAHAMAPMPGAKVISVTSQLIRLNGLRRSWTAEKPSFSHTP